MEETPMTEGTEATPAVEPVVEGETPAVEGEEVKPAEEMPAEETPAV